MRHCFEMFVHDVWIVEGAILEVWSWGLVLRVRCDEFAADREVEWLVDRVAGICLCLRASRRLFGRTKTLFETDGFGGRIGKLVVVSDDRWR